jgi:hypothetical protein
VQGDLTLNDVAQDFAGVAHDGGAGFIAGGFYTEDQQGAKP